MNPTKCDLAPLRHIVEEVKKVTQGCEVSVWQHAGQQHGGRGPFLLCRELLGLEEGLLQLCGERRLWQLSEELFHQTGYITRKRGGQALLTRIQFGLDEQNTALLC